MIIRGDSRGQFSPITKAGKTRLFIDSAVELSVVFQRSRAVVALVSGFRHRPAALRPPNTNLFKISSLFFKDPRAVPQIQVLKQEDFPGGSRCKGVFQNYFQRRFLRGTLYTLKPFINITIQ